MISGLPISRASSQATRLLRETPPGRLRFQPSSYTRQSSASHKHPRWIRGYSSSNSPPPRKTLDTRAERILSRLPPSWQKYTSRLRSAPVSHVVAFLILHELTAIVPLLGLFGLFHYTERVPLGYMMDHYGEYVRSGVRRFERYFRRKGWFGFGTEEGNDPTPEAVGAEGEDTVLQKWESADGKYKVVVEVALAYAITKALLPVRIMGSLWATPWFAGVLARVRSLVRRRA